ncbi:MAG: HPr family phosphocarrier protein [Propionibacteriaceae bacterium]|jgi:phosphotransferase system HPr (HPr) family protein|nr:HPr family phosphocarrier protein [Propionibacteriaceae bacterium]
MIVFDHTITDPAGLHARPAGRLVQQAQAHASQIQLTRADRTVSAKKLFAVMSLAVKGGDLVQFSCDGPDEAAAAEALRQVLATEGI